MKEANYGLFSNLLNRYISAVPSCPEDYASHKRDLILPIVPVDILEKLCTDAERTFASEPIVLNVSPPVVIVGDLHGQILDLYRILLKYGLPDKRQYLFLGDIVDRGEFSIEAITIIYLLKVLYPKRVYLIRGNHEFAFLCEQSGFLGQLNEVYQDRAIFDKFLQSFSYIPLVAMVDHTMLCVHGGLGPEWTTLGQVTKMKRPINDFDNDVLNAMLWSDPTFDTDDFAPSNRGIGYLFGKNTVNDFIKRTGIKVIVRAHECVNSGFQGLFDGKLLTVFSASNYCGVIGNQSAVLQVTSAFRYEPFRFPSLPYLRRGQAIFRVEVIEQAITSRNLPKRQSIPSVHSTLAHLNRPQPNKPHFESPRKAGNQPKITRPLTSYRVTKSLESRIYGHH